MSFTRTCALALFLALTGCPAGGGSHGASSNAAPSPTFANEAEILKADASRNDVQVVLASLALDKSRTASMRYAALRRLEEGARGNAVIVAEKLATDGSRNQDAEFLRKNSIALLVRAKSPEGQASLDRVKASSIDSALLAARLTQAEAR